MTKFTKIYKKELFKIKRGIDVGNYSLKEYPNTNIKSLVSLEENILGSKLHLEYENKHYYIGEGNFETELNKSNKENFLPLLLTGIALNSNKDDIFMQIVVGLPINQFKANKHSLENLILSSRVREIKLNNINRKIIISDFKVYPEAIGAYYSLDSQEDVIIVDLGGRTTDVAYIVNKKVVTSSTIAVGTLNIYKDIADKLNSEYGLDLGLPEAERIIEKGFLEIDGLKISLSFVTDILKRNFMKINDDLTIKYPIRTEKIVLVGGGSVLFKQAFKNRYNNSSVADNHIFANSIGFLKVAKELWS